MSVKILAHVLPSNFEKHDNAHWQALEHRWLPPFLLTTDNFAAATNVWRLDQLAATSSNEQDDPQPILLSPSLPIYPYLTNAHITSPDERFLALISSCDRTSSWRVYDLSTGSLISESGLQGYSYSGSYWQNAGKFAALAVEEDDRQVILRYTLTNEGKLEQVGCAVAAAEVLGFDSFGLEHLAKDGSIFTTTTVIPSRRPLRIAYYPPHSDRTTIPAVLDVPFSTEGKNGTFSKSVIQISERALAMVVEEGEWGADMNPIAAVSTVRLVTYTACPTPGDEPGISLSWTVNFEHAIDQITYVPSLGTGTIVVLGQWHAPYPEDGPRAPNKLILTFLDASTGALLRQTEQTFDRDGYSAHRFIGPDWVVYNRDVQTPWLYAIPLARVMEIGLEGVENSEGQMDVQVKKLEVRNGPKPWNSKVRKSAEQGRWRWVKNTEVLPDGKLVLFSDRGPEFWVLDYAAISSV